MTRERRLRAERGGRRAETLAALFLQCKGFSILARRFKSPGGEIDIVARRGKLLVFAEVKARKDADGAILAVTPSARRRIEAASRAFLSHGGGFAEFAVRYDIIAVSGLSIRHVADAWREWER